MSDGLKVYGLTCNYLKNPIGLDSPPRLSWKIYSKIRGQKQTAYRLCVASTRENLDKGIYDVWDSGKVFSSNSIHVPFGGVKLSPRRRYWWKVFVYDVQDIPYESEIAFFETGKLDEKWCAKWITAHYIKNETSSYIAPLLRTAFYIDDLPAEARLYICGLGYFQAYINGQRVSDDVLSPPFTKYDSTVLYMTYDVTGLLKPGKNALGVILGNGWYNCFAEDPWNSREAAWRHIPKLIAELHLKLNDGSCKVIVTDNRWKASKSPIIFNSIRNGEYYDARLEIPGWNTSNFDDSTWENVRVVRPPGGLLRACEMQPIRVVKEIKPIKMWQTSAGSWIFDIGQNIAGAARIKIEGKRGTEITIRYSDRLKGNNLDLDQDSIKGFVKSGEFQTDRYVKKSDDVEVWNPIFVYHGFQYVEISGIDYKPTLDAVTALVMHTDFEKRGHFKCSDQYLNKIQKMCYWSTVSNYHSVPTDCPHREKNPWTGDASLSAEQTILNFSPMAAYIKWLRDFKDAQRPNGSIPCIVPSTGWGYNWGNGPDWSSALTMIPWYMYLYCGDRDVLREMYDVIKKHCDFITEMATDYIVEYGIGDWCAPFEGPAIAVNMASFKSPIALTDTAYYYLTALTVSKIAKILGKHEEYHRYKELSQNIKKAFRMAFYDKENVRIMGDCQTSTACMLYCGLAEDEEKPALFELLLRQIEQKGCHLDVGVLGMKFLLNTLGEMGKPEIGLQMILQDTFPSFRWWVDMGATTLWECWNGQGSHNHHAFSDVSAFFYKYIGGICPDEEEPGFRHIILRPALECGLSSVECRHDSMYGEIECSWYKKDEMITLHVKVPVGSHATLYLPLSYKGRIKENGKSIEEVYSIKTNIEASNVLIDLVSGEYCFEVI